MPTASLRRLALGFALSLGLTLGSSAPAAASVLYDFSLPANGEIDAVRIVLTVPTFIMPGGLEVWELSLPAIETTSGTPVDPDNSVIGVDVLPDATLFGIDLIGPTGNLVLYTVEYPEHFFVFERTPMQVGTFTSVSGLVESDDELETLRPVATLVVSGTPDVPEPATVTLLGAAALGAIARRRRQQ